MKIYSRDGLTAEIPIEAEHLWIIWKCHQQGLIKVCLKIVYKKRTFFVDFDAVDVERTFRQAVLENHPSILPPDDDERADTISTPPESGIPDTQRSKR